MHFMNMAAHYGPQFVFAGSSSSSGSLTSILSAGTEVVTWMIVQMGAYLKFITDNPLVLIMFIILLAGSGIGFLMRLWNSV